MFEAFHSIIGSNPDTITWWQMSCRAIGIFFSALLLVRFGGTRVFGRNSSFDIVMSVILGSILSRALTGNARFLPTLAAAAVLVFIHAVLANLSFRSRTIGHFIKGRETQLIKDGRLLMQAMKKTNITTHDLMEAVRSTAKLEDLSSVRDAYLERDGSISVILKS